MESNKNNYNNNDNIGHSSCSSNSKRLYVGNLDLAVDEFSLLKLFKVFGTITHLDFMFHRSGVRKGQPRGFCFIEYSSKQEALKAAGTMDGKLLLGRRLKVNLLKSSESQQYNTMSTPSSKSINLTCLRSQKLANSSLDTKIAALQDKLNRMKESDSTDTSLSSISGSGDPPTKTITKLSTTTHRYKPYPKK